MFTPSAFGMIAIAIVVVAVLFRIYGVTVRNFVLIVVGIMLVTLILMKQTEVTYYTHLVLHVFSSKK